MERITFKSSTVWIGTEESVEVYQSLADVPVKLREKISANIQGERAVTIMIADKRGRQELVRLLATRDSSVSEIAPIAPETPSLFFNRLELVLFALVVMIVALAYFIFFH